MDNATATTPADLVPHYRSKLGLSYDPSSYQAAIFDAIEHGRGHTVVEAVAGSGKTTTIVNAARLIAGAGLFLAFNKHIATELGDRLRDTNMEAKTIHGVGFGAIRFAQKGVRVKVEAKKYRGFLRNFENEFKNRESVDGRKLSRIELEALDEHGFPRSTILRLLDLARVNLIDHNGPDFKFNLLGLVNHHGLDLDEDLEDLVVEIVRGSMKLGAKVTTEIDFTDMIWLPTVHGWRPKGYAFVFVDEAQDLSKAQLAIARACCRRGGRMVFVGDRMQAIYGFAGADANSFQNIIDSTDATVLPLSVCYRCPTSHVELARELCPQIEAGPGAGEGVVRSIKRDDLCMEISEGDLVLCRVNAPLLSICYTLIADGISAAVRGRDIGAGLCKIVDEISKTVANFRESFGEAVVEWKEEQKEIVRRRGGDDDLQEEAFERIDDQAECVRIVFSTSKAASADELKNAIESLFADDRPSVVLSSVHRAKGLENDRIFIAEPDRLRKPRGKRAWMLAQEKNLHYVALTRAKSELVFVEGKRGEG